MANSEMSKKTKVYQTVFKVALIVFAFYLVFILISMAFSSESLNYDEADFVQLSTPSDDATVVVFETTKGIFKAVLYEDEAPKYCKYFKELVEEGYFDDTYVCTILKNTDGNNGGFIGGSKTEDGVSNDQSNTKMKKLEVSENVLPIKGSLCSLVKQKGMFSSAKAGSVVTFLNDVTDNDELDKNLEETGDKNGLGKVTEIFKKYGGVPNYVQMYTIFGQVYDGWDVYDSIVNSQIVDEGKSDDDENKNYSPSEEIKFTKVYLSTYGNEKSNGYNLSVKE